MWDWEAELESDHSDIWSIGSKPVQVGTQQNAPEESAPEEEEEDDDLAFPSRAPTQLVPGFARVLALEDESGVAQPRSENEVVHGDVARAATQVTSLQAFLHVPRGDGGGPATVPPATQHLPTDSRPPLPPLRLFQPVVAREVPSPTPSSERLQARALHHSSLKGKAPAADIRKYFKQLDFSSRTGEGGSRKKPAFPGPVGELFRKGQAREVGGDGIAALGSGEDDFNGTVFRKGAWIGALRSLGVEEFDPARYAILKATARSIGTSSAQKVPHFVAVIQELTPNGSGDAAVILKDPTGTVAGMMNNKVFSNTDHARAISPGAVIVLKQVSVFSPSPSARYLNISVDNVSQVFPANTDVPQGSASK